MEKKILKNEKVQIEYNEKTAHNPKPYIFIIDKTDQWNETRAYTQNVRGIKTAMQFMDQIFNSYELRDDLTFYDIVRILNEKFNLKTRSYCAMD